MIRKDMEQEISHYLRETLGISVSIHSPSNLQRLPQYLRQHYHLLLARFEIGDDVTDCLIAVDRSRQEQSASVTVKQMARLEKLGAGPVIYARVSMTSYNRKRLLQRNIPFIVPGNQMYLPFLGMDLREHFRGTAEERVAFRPATQVLLLHVILNRKAGPFSSQELAHELGYSKMTLTRTLNQLELADIGVYSRQGRKRLVSFMQGGKELWDLSLPYLRSPVQRSYFVPQISMISGELSGESALSLRTMLAQPRTRSYACSRRDLRQMEDSVDLQHLEYEADGACRLEVWKYPPEKLTKDDIVDPLSLYLSLMDSEDERIQTALQELLGSISW